MNVTTDNDKNKLISIINKIDHIQVVYDCGSRDALDGIELATKINAKELHIFECNPDSFKICENNIKKYNVNAVLDVYLNQCAISDQTGEIDFYPINTTKTKTAHKDGNPGASSLLKANERYKVEKYVQDHITVKSTTLFDYCKTHRSPDVLWMDLQGAELIALKGASDVLNNVKVIHTEVGFRRMYEEQALFWDIDKYLKNRSFKRMFIDMGRWPNCFILYRLFKTGPWISNAIYAKKQ